MANELEAILGAAESAIGVQYKWGGNSLASGVDCSGLVQQAYLAAGIALPRVSASQMRVGQPVASVNEAQPGDLIGYQTGNRNGSGVEHIAIYIGNGQMIEAYRTGAPVRVTEVRPGATFRRIVGNIAPTRPAGAVQLGPHRDRIYTTAATTNMPAPPPQVEAQAVTAPPEGGLGDDLPDNATEEQTLAYIREHLPQYAPWLENDEIRYVLTWAVREDKADAEIQGALQRTNYFRTHGPSSRALDSLLATDHAAAEQVISGAKNIVGDLFSRNGISLDDAALGELAKNALRAGTIGFQGGQVFVSSEDRLNEMVAFGLGASGKPATGEAGKQVSDLAAIARDYFVPVTRSGLEDWQRRILAGAASEDQFREWLAGQARAAFDNDDSVLRSIDQGRSPAEHFQAHRAAIAQALELDEDAVDLMDPRYRDVLQHRDETGRVRSMSWVEAERWARERPEFANTTQYHQQTADTATQLARWMGVSA